MNKLLKVFPLVILLFSVSVTASSKPDIDSYFSKMKALVGSWKVEGSKNSKFEISFELTANNTTLIETWLYEGKKHSLTLYHLDGDSMIATHYCPQGNQPRLRLTSDSTLEKLKFSYFDATNLKNLHHSHQHSLCFELSPTTDKIVRKETYLSLQGEKPSELKLVRK